MSRYHLSSTSRALYRIFIAPNLTSSPFRLQHTFLLPQAVRLLPPISTRSAGTYTRNKQKRHTLADSFTFDNAIDATYIDFVDTEGRFFENVLIDDAYRTFKRVSHHLVLLKPAPVDEDGVPDPNARPLCKVISKIELRAQHEKKVALERRLAMGKEAGDVVVKNLELNWAIESADLKHRLDKLRQFLEEGKKVEILIGPKRRGRQATEQECRGLLKAIKDLVLDIKGTSEAQEPEGVMGGVMTLIYQGPKQNKVKEDVQDEVDEKKAKKEKGKLREEKKAERRKKMAEMDRRNKKPGDTPASV